MSSKSTLLLLPCCHIYTDNHFDVGNTLCIEVYYGDICDDTVIEAYDGSEFAKLIKQFVSSYKESK